MTIFAQRSSIEQVEMGTDFAPRFDAGGLLPVIVIDDATSAVLMLGYMNADALRLTLERGEAHFWSRSRKAIWRKGEHSGFTQTVACLLVDDDQDALVLRVTLSGPGSCHVGYRSCFYRQVACDEAGKITLVFNEAEQAFDADAVYAGLANPTIL